MASTPTVDPGFSSLSDSSPFLDAFHTTMGFEGGASNGKNDTGGPSIHGISSKWWPKDYAKQKALVEAGDTQGAHSPLLDFSKTNQWDTIPGIDKMDPALQKIVFDTAVNNGVPAAKKMLAKSEGDPSDLLAARAKADADIIKRNPEQAANLSSWTNRMTQLAQNIPKTNTQSDASQLP